jgi:hypothetical protein
MESGFIFILCRSHLLQCDHQCTSGLEARNIQAISACVGVGEEVQYLVLWLSRGSGIDRGESLPGCGMRAVHLSGRKGILQ